MKKVKNIFEANKKPPNSVKIRWSINIIKRIGCAVAVFRGVQNRGCRLIVHTCCFKVSLKNDGFSSNFRDFGSHDYNGLILKSGYLSLKMKKVCTPLVID